MESTKTTVYDVIQKSKHELVDDLNKNFTSFDNYADRYLKGNPSLDSFSKRASLHGETKRNGLRNEISTILSEEEISAIKEDSFISSIKKDLHAYRSAKDRSYLSTLDGVVDTSNLKPHNLLIEKDSMGVVEFVPNEFTTVGGGFLTGLAFAGATAAYSLATDTPVGPELPLGAIVTWAGTSAYLSRLAHKADKKFNDVIRKASTVQSYVTNLFSQPTSEE